MAPTWVLYHENYAKSVDGQVVRDESASFRGFFGNCRAIFGIQVRVWKGLKVGSEVGYSFLNYMEMTTSSSGGVSDSSFRFPVLRWNFSLRYEVL